MLSLKEASKLISSSKDRKERGLFIVEGKKMAREALSIKGAVECLILTESFAASDLGKELLEDGSFDASVVPDSSLKKVSGLVTPEGVMAAVRTEEIRKSLQPRLRENNNKGFPILFLEELQDPGNLGTIIRSAEAAGVSEIVLSKGCVDPFSPKVVRSTMGSIFRVPVFECESEEKFFEVITEKKAEGFSFYAAALSGKRAYTDINFGEKAAVLIGNEAKGLSERAIGACDKAMKIPMEGASESLNAAVACSVIMFEIKRQRGKL